MQQLHHALELAHLFPAGTRRAIAMIGRKEPQRVVAPMVGEAQRAETFFVCVLMNGEQLHGGDPKVHEMADERWVRQTGIRSAQCFGDIRVQLGGVLDMYFIDHRLGPWREGRGIARPVECVVHHH